MHAVMQNANIGPVRFIIHFMFIKPSFVPRGELHDRSEMPF